MLKFLKGLSSVNQAHAVTLVNNVVAGVVTFVPAWSGKEQTIAAALSGVAANVYPLVAAVHRAVDALAGLPGVSAASIASQAEAQVKAEVTKVDFNKLVAEAAAAHETSISQVESLVEAKVRTVLAGLSTPPAAPAAVAPVPPAA